MLLLKRRSCDSDAPFVFRRRLFLLFRSVDPDAGNLGGLPLLALPPPTPRGCRNVENDDVEPFVEPAPLSAALVVVVAPLSTGDRCCFDPQTHRSAVQWLPRPGALDFLAPESVRLRESEPPPPPLLPPLFAAPAAFVDPPLPPAPPLPTLLPPPPMPLYTNFRATWPPKTRAICLSRLPPLAGGGGVSPSVNW